MTESKSVALPLGYTPSARDRQNKNGEPTGIRTPDTRLRRPLLYPTELWTHMPNMPFKKIGADDENRTHAISLEG